jgi:hypothetical protein
MFSRPACSGDPSLAPSGAKEASMASWATVRRVAAKRSWREGEAEVVLEAWRRSGESLTAFARRLGVLPCRLSRWERRLAAESEGGAVRFHPVRLVERAAETSGSPTASAPIEIALVGGTRVRLPRGFEPKDLRHVLALLAERSC